VLLPAFGTAVKTLFAIVADYEWIAVDLMCGLANATGFICGTWTALLA